MAKQLGRVYLIGAGPGDPGLLTLRGLECLRSADIVIHDTLVSRRILTYASTSAQILSLTHFGSRHPERLPKVVERMIAEARSGKEVVRLKAGDPLIFGRGGEEAEALNKAGIPYEIVPGVTAALAAGAYAEVPLTQRNVASAVAFVTAHECPGKLDASVDWEKIARFPGTTVFYMGMARIRDVADALRTHGASADMPVVVVQNASRGNQRTLASTLERLAADAEAAGFKAPSVILVGPVTAHRPAASWADRRPLKGRRVVVCRPGDQGHELARRIELAGGIPLLAPAFKIVPPESWAAVDDAINRLGSFDWLVFTSKNGVEAFFSRLMHQGKDLRALGDVHLAAIGSATAQALESYHLTADLVPSEYVSEVLAKELLPRVKGQQVLLVRAAEGREVLQKELGALATVHQVAVYRQEIDPDLGQSLKACWQEGPPDFIVLTSSNIARLVLGALDQAQLSHVRAGACRLVTISPVTSGAVREMGLVSAAVAEPHTMDGIMVALERLVAG